MELTGRVALVTGATRGIGEVIARRLSGEGATVIVHGRHERKCVGLVSDLVAAGGNATYVCGDIGESETAQALASHVASEFGTLDIAVLNAGAIAYGAFWDISESDFDEMMAVNVRGPWLCAKALHSLMPRGASIIVTGSVSSMKVFPGETVYGASKGAAEQLMRGLAYELAERGIRVNAIAPGVVLGAGMSQDAVNAAEDSEQALAEMLATTPLGRGGTTDEMADAVVFLAGPRSTFITGQTVVVDGGILLN